MSFTRTNIEIDDRAVEAVMRKYDLKTKRDAVNMALRHVAGHPMTKDEILATVGTGVFGDVPGEERVPWPKDEAA
jgi:Arc/MetJ family transcription regulator